MILPLLDEPLAQCQPLIIALGIRGRPLHDGLGADGPHPSLGNCTRDLILIVVHVGETGHTRTDHLGAGKKGAPTAKLRTYELALHRQHVAE